MGILKLTLSLNACIPLAPFHSRMLSDPSFNSSNPRFIRPFRVIIPYCSDHICIPTLNHLSPRPILVATVTILIVQDIPTLSILELVDAHDLGGQPDMGSKRLGKFEEYLLLLSQDKIKESLIWGAGRWRERVV